MIASWLTGLALLAQSIAQPTPFEMAVVRRCAGEGSHPAAMQMCACSVRHRLQAGWAQERVLDAYYAPDVAPSEQGLVAAQLGLRGACEGREYFYVSGYDADRLGFDVAEAVGVVRWSGKEVMSFSREHWRERRAK